MSELTSSLRNLKKQSEPRQILISGNLGITLDGYNVVDVPGRSGYVYVRLLNNTSELVQAYNGVVSTIYNLPVLVERNKDRYEIYGRDILQYQNWGNTPYLPIHGNQHSFDRSSGGGGDVVWVHQEQFYPLAPTPSGTYEGRGLIVAPYVYNWYGEWHYAGNTGTPDVAGAYPTGSSSARLMLLCLEGDTEIFHYITGSVEVPNTITSIAELVPYFPTDWYDPLIDIPIAVIRITSGTSTIGWDEIYDVRQFYGREQAGGGTGSAGVSNHNDLLNIDGGTPGEYYHFTHADYDDLTDGGATTLHSHALPVQTPHRVVITDHGGAITTENNLVYDDRLMIMGADTIPATNPVASHLVSEGDGAVVDLWTYSDADASYFVGHRARNTIIAPEAIKSGDILLYIRGRGYDGAWTGSRAGITFKSTEDWATGTSNGTQILFHTTELGSTVMNEVVRITDDGHVDINAGATYDIDGTAHTHTGTAGIGDVLDSGIIVGQLVKGITDNKHVTAAAIIPPVTNILTITNANPSTLALNISTGKILVLAATDTANLWINTDVTYSYDGINKVSVTLNNNTSFSLVEFTTTNITGGGTLALGGFTGGVPATGTFAMGAGTLTAATVNDVTGATHTHAITVSPTLLGNGTAQYQVIVTGANPFIPVYSTFLLDGTATGKTVFAVTGAKTLTLTATDNFNLTVPATGTAALLATTNNFSIGQIITGSTDMVQLAIHANATQTTNIQTWETSASVVLAQIDGAGNWGLGIAPSVTTRLYSYIQLTNTAAAGYYANYFWLQAIPSASSASGFMATRNYMLFSGTQPCTNNSTGVQNVSQTTSTALLNLMRGETVQLSLTGTGGVTTGYAIYIQTPIKTGAGDFVTLAGLYIEDQSVGTTANYAIRTNAGNVVFNEGGDINTDFRVESDTEPNMIFLDSNGDTDGALYLGGSTNGVKINKGGELTLIGTATVYKDINIAGMLLSKPTSSAPGLDTFRSTGTVDTTIETYAFAEDEKVHGGFELQHDYKEGSDLVFHVHWQGITAPTGTDQVQWRLNYFVARDGVTLAAATVFDSPDTAIDTQYRMYRTDFAVITGTTFKIGDQFMFTLTRVTATGDAYAGETLIETAGIHYEVDTIGSKTISAK